MTLSATMDVTQVRGLDRLLWPRCHLFGSTLAPVLTCARWASIARNFQQRPTDTKTPLFLRRTFSRRTFLKEMRWAPVLFLPAPMFGSHIFLPSATGKQSSTVPFDFRLTPHTAFRTEADWLATRFFSVNQRNFQIVSGLVFNF